MISIAIQAGGLSSRMGTDKGLVKLSGIPLIERVYSKVIGLSDDVFITTNTPEHYAFLGIPLFGDQHPGSGALHGLETALKASKHSHTLVLACDLPFVNSDLISRIICESTSADITIPFWNDRYQPLHAIYKGSTCLPEISKAMVLGRKRLVSFFSGLSMHIITPEVICEYDPEGNSFFNINTKEDLTTAEKIFRNP